MIYNNFGQFPCGKCGKTCQDCSCGECKPAKYGCGFNDIQADPFDSSKWKVTNHGVMQTVDIPKIAETDTVLSTNYSNASLIYTAEAHTDQITGAQLGSLINVKDLRDVKFDAGIDGTCYELIYHKFFDCGKGCKSAADQWENWNVNSEGAKRTSIHYVRGANEFGCPVYLDEPPRTGEYWFGMWDPTSEEGFTYVQAVPGELPTNENGDPIVMSTDENGKPIKGVIPLNCIFTNLMQNFGIDVFGSWSVVQATPGFTYSFNPVSGDWSITWNDWVSESPAGHVGTGVLRGKMDWSTTLDSETGSVTYHITAVHYYDAVWTVDRGAGSSGPIKLTIRSVVPGTGAQGNLLEAYSYSGNSNWSQTFNVTIPSDFSVTVGPGQTSAPVPFVYIFVDWIADDEGYVQANFRNKLFGWTACT